MSRKDDRRAIALRYVPGQMEAPQISASGARLQADRIKQVAMRYGVPLERNPELTKKLWEMEITEQIPDSLYEDVAGLLVRSKRKQTRP